jgi:hypothetical protein
VDALFGEMDTSPSVFATVTVPSSEVSRSSASILMLNTRSPFVIAAVPDLASPPLARMKVNIPTGFDVLFTPLTLVSSHLMDFGFIVRDCSAPSTV